MVGSPNYVGVDFNCSRNELTDLIGSPNYVGDDFSCNENKLTTLNGSPEKINGDFSCYNNYLTDLIGSPNYVGGYFSCEDNHLTSLFGAPKIIKGVLYFRNNPNLLDVSDIWNSDIKSSIFFDLNKEMAILPLIKFSNLQCNNELLSSIQIKNRGSSKQNIIDFQYDLIENRFEENARWKPV